MSKPQKPVRQDYIAKVRYTNNLPPPPLNPKFIKYNTTNTTTQKQENEYLMSSVFRKENFNQFIGHIDEEFGLPLNPIYVRGFLDGSDENAIFVNSKVALHPEDRVLLRDAGIGNVNKSEPGVSFLRRTEYIAERQANRVEDKSQSATQTEKDEQVDPDSQLRAVEQSFEEAQESLANYEGLKHPRKKHLKAVGAFPLLPDTSMMDTKFLMVKFTGSASITRELQSLKQQEKDAYDENLQNTALLTSIYRPITSEDGEWVSFYQNKDRKAVDELTSKLQSTEREQPGNLLDEDQDTSSFRFKHVKSYDMQYHRFSKPYEELALKLVPTETGSKKRRMAYYYPISGRVELKKHRASANTEINRFLDDSTVDVINLKLREPTTSELKKMDTARSEYDPMEYEGEDDEEIADEDGESDDIADEFDKATEAEENGT